MSYTMNIEGTVYGDYFHVTNTKNKYRSYDTIHDCYKALKEHDNWLKSKDDKEYIQILGLEEDNGLVITHKHTYTLYYLFEHFVWADDKTPFGMINNRK